MADYNEIPSYPTKTRTRVPHNWQQTHRKATKPWRFQMQPDIYHNDQNYQQMIPISGIGSAFSEL